MMQDHLIDAVVAAVVARDAARVAAVADGPIPGPAEEVGKLRRAIAALALTLSHPAEAGVPVQAALAEDPPSADLCIHLLRSLFPPEIARDGEPALLERFRLLAMAARHPRSRAIAHRLAWERAYWHHRPREAHTIALAAIPDTAPDADLGLEFQARAFYASLAAYDLAAAAGHWATLEPHEARLAAWGFNVRHGRDEYDLLTGRSSALLARAESRRAAGDPGWAWSVLPWPLIHAALFHGREEFAEEVLEQLGRVRGPVAGMRAETVAGNLRVGRLVLAIYRRRYRAAREMLGEAGLATATSPTLHRVVQVLAVRIAGIDGDGARMRAGLRLIDPAGDAGDAAMLWVLLDLCEGRVADARRRFARLVRSHPPSVVRLHLDELFELSPGRFWEFAQDDREPAAEPLSGPGTAEPGDLRLVGADPALRQVQERIDRYAPHDQPVLVVGETGTGKEIVARLLHRAGAHPAGPFLALNCGSLTDTLAEAELFGHAKGAFTGAAGDREGLLAAAGDGTLFLDEVNSLPLRLQGMLLRVLEDGEYRRVGDTRPRRSRARIVAASNEDLAAAVEAGRFRADLLFRLSRLRIEVPPLRDRRGDIPILARHLLDQISPGRGIAIADDLLPALTAHPWPGNVRELRNVLERAVILARRPGVVSRADCPDLGPVPRESAPASAPPAPAVPVPGTPRARERRRRLLDLFAEHPHLYAIEAVARIGCAPRTCAADLAALAEAGLVRRVVTSGNLGTSYWVRC